MPSPFQNAYHGYERRPWWKAPLLWYALIFVLYAAASEIRVAAARSDGIASLKAEIQRLREDVAKILARDGR